MILDSTVLIDFLRGKQNAVDVLSLTNTFYTTEINVYELTTGIFLVRNNSKLHLDKLNAVLARLIVLPLDRKAAIKAGEITADLIKKGLTIEESDCLIAGIALSNNIQKIITANKDHFSRISEMQVISY